MTAPNPEGDVPNDVRRAAAALAVEWYCHPNESAESKAEAATQWKGFVSMARAALAAAPAALQPSPAAPSDEPVAWRARMLPDGYWYAIDPEHVEKRRADPQIEVQPLYARQQAAPGRESEPPQ